MVVESAVGVNAKDIPLSSPTIWISARLMSGGGGRPGDISGDKTRGTIEPIGRSTACIVRSSIGGKSGGGLSSSVGHVRDGGDHDALCET